MNYPPYCLYKTTVVIWSTNNPSETEEDLCEFAYESTNGKAYNSKYATVLIQKPEDDPDWDGTQFFKTGKR